MEFDGSGRVSSLYYKPTNRQLISGTYGNDGFIIYKTGFADIYLSEVYRTQTNKLLASSYDGSYQVLFGVVEDDKYIAFRIENVIGFDPTQNTKFKFRIRPTISPVRIGSSV